MLCKMWVLIGGGHLFSHYFTAALVGIRPATQAPLRQDTAEAKQQAEAHPNGRKGTHERFATTAVTFLLLVPFS